MGEAVNYDGEIIVVLVAETHDNICTTREFNVEFRGYLRRVRKEIREKIDFREKRPILDPPIPLQIVERQNGRGKSMAACEIRRESNASQGQTDPGSLQVKMMQ